mmetsp:Transcript_26544/g.61933  ORF Transcript_26544/g.61933 Transcript_26544/m.61933 type:complete len:243 (-) Transcript_26544:88-816(-)
MAIADLGATLLASRPTLVRCCTNPAMSSTCSKQLAGRYGLCSTAYSHVAMTVNSCSKDPASSAWAEAVTSLWGTRLLSSHCIRTSMLERSRTATCHHPCCLSTSASSHSRMTMAPCVSSLACGVLQRRQIQSQANGVVRGFVRSHWEQQLSATSGRFMGARPTTRQRHATFQALSLLQQLSGQQTVRTSFRFGLVCRTTFSRSCLQKRKSYAKRSECQRVTSYRLDFGNSSPDGSWRVLCLS